MARFTIIFKVDTDDLDQDTLKEYLHSESEDDPSVDDLHDALRDWLDDDKGEVLGDNLISITETKE